MTASPLILGHRGAMAYAPENTLEAFELGADQGADGMEIDIHATKDGVIVAIHDDTIDRTSNGTGRVSELTFAELRRLDFGTGNAGDYAGALIPTLDEIFDLVERRSLVLNIEVKDIYRHDATYGELARRAADEVLRRGLNEQVFFSSFNHTSMAQLKISHPDVRTGLLHMMSLHEIGHYAATTQADAIHPAQLAVTPETMEQARAANLRVNAWTMPAPFSSLSETEQIEQLIAAGVDSIITNIPDVAVAQRAAAAALSAGVLV
ncbi:glycerophosphoryl diester phosphodiesterase [Salinibacterium amurskyense]|uniref:Glycerophosphoryl diester phosphodiesterase n=1 Tax=Salinibacterium amurskyense TaxID=205941 RepID=A0A2M9D7R0_9MICO|nr:glycerophosphodiester phosphodiesterase family protein [Salinibacterium amurskyense]PJJ81741.1 glycerophosphoryl diester phosphodiesterase [Salinibacterium amurskyense]RLQ83716.1 glycerophosphodiester phosphodiesterase [Salinibacterium amurskyense]GHD79428.1 glycerophosphoryl diester phosphodiesterase [Salinibacterium amurskyense]